MAKQEVDRSKLPPAIKLTKETFRQASPKVQAALRSVARQIRDNKAS